MSMSGIAASGVDVTSGGGAGIARGSAFGGGPGVGRGAAGRDTGARCGTGLGLGFAAGFAGIFMPGIFGIDCAATVGGTAKATNINANSNRNIIAARVRRSHRPD
jgi:hypothetical protein